MKTVFFSSQTAGRTCLPRMACSTKASTRAASLAFHSFSRALRTSDPTRGSRKLKGYFGKRLPMIEPPNGAFPPPEATDSELIARCGTGDAGAFAEFYDRHSVLLHSVAFRVLDDRHEAEEALQEAARTIWERAPQYDAALGKPSSWAVVIVRHKAIDRLRARQRRNGAVERVSAELGKMDAAASVAPPPNAFLDSETAALLHNALAVLPTEQRCAIELAFFAGLSQSEVATRLGEPLGTIKARIRRGMLAMREALEEKL